MKSRAFYTVVAVAGIAIASGAAWWYQNKPARALVGNSAVGAASAPGGSAAAGGSTASKPPTVEAARVEVLKLSDGAQAVGSLRSRQGVMLKPEVSGRVARLNFHDGERVRKGQLLVQLDDQLVAAQVQQAQAELSIAQANHKRNQELVAQNFISKRSVDESAANLQVAQAKLALAQATAARMRIVAPFDGIAGIGSVNVGDYLKDGADIVNIEDMDAVFVDFRLPERFQTKVQRGQHAMVEVDALPGRKFTAVVQAIDPAVDANGRSLGIRACIDNRELQLRPGMFARVNAVFGERENALVIPEEAIVPQAGRVFVYRLVNGPDKETRTAQRIAVKVGLRQAGRVEVTEGLNAGDIVVTAGQQRIQKDGQAVRVMEIGAPGGAAAAAAGAARAGNAEAAKATPAASTVPAASTTSTVAASSSAVSTSTSPGGIPRALAAPKRGGPNPCEQTATAPARTRAS